MKDIQFELTSGDYIQLIQLLKAANVVPSGSDAQQVVVQGLVKRNGEVELRKRAKCVVGDVIEFAGTRIMLT